MKMGITGFPGAGKTTIFNALTGLAADVGAAGSASTRPNLGVIKVPDPRVDALTAIFHPRKQTYAEMTFVDFPDPPGEVGRLDERVDGHYWNPLREGALTPFHDFGAPVIDRIVAERGGRVLQPGALIGVVNLIAVAHDNPPISAPPPWRGLPVTPALVRWRLIRDGRAVIPWRVAADFRTTLRNAFDFPEIYASGTRQNHPNARGRYRFWLARAWDTRQHRDGRYRLDVEVADVRGNSSRGHLELVLLNDEV